MHGTGGTQREPLEADATEGVRFLPARLQAQLY